MPQEEQQLRFSIEESVWFQKGQEVSELLSISLDPDISIHEHDQYVSIRGALLLMGEYKIDEQANEKVDFFEYGNMRYVNEITTREDGVSVLTHRFPVDITIPRNRIENLNEVFVTIESFDYDLPEIKCLKLVADLSINGIIKEEQRIQQEPFIFEEDDEEEIEVVSKELTEESFVEELNDTEETGEQIEYSRQFVEEEDDEQVEYSREFVEEEDDSEQAEYSEPFIEEDNVEQIGYSRKFVEEDNENLKSDEEFLKKDHFDEPEETYPLFTIEDEETGNEKSSFTLSREDDVEKLSSNSDNAFFTINFEEEDDEVFEVEVRKEPIEEVQEIQYSLLSGPKQTAKQEKVVEQREEEPKHRDNANYLASLFARDDEEDFSKLKICIVQQGETLDMICERYDLTVQQIIRVNDFGADNDVYEGQILYIPAYSTTK